MITEATVAIAADPFPGRADFLAVEAPAADVPQPRAWIGHELSEEEMERFWTELDVACEAA